MDFVMKNSNFKNLENNELKELNGGVAPILIKIGVGALETVVVAVAVDTCNELVKRNTGKSITEHGANIVEGVFSIFK